MNTLFLYKAQEVNQNKLTINSKQINYKTDFLNSDLQQKTISTLKM